jgi:hypothetical protein
VPGKNRSRQEILDRISGFSGLTGFYLKDGDLFRLGLVDADGDVIKYVDFQD